MKPDFVRLYPSLVLKHTSLYSMYQKGLYVPWSLGRTVDALAKAVKSFNDHNIPIARVGLQPDISLKNNLIAGPFHPSIRYLVDCRLGLERMKKKICLLKTVPSKIIFRVPNNLTSIYTGHKRENLTFLKKKFDLDDIRIMGDSACSQLELLN